MLAKDVVERLRSEDRLEIRQNRRIVWSGYVKEIDLDDKLMNEDCWIIEPFYNENKENGTRLTIQDSVKIDDSFKIDKDMTVGELLYNYVSDTTVIRIVENKEIIYEDYMSEFENDDLLNKKVVGIDCFVCDAHEAGIIVFI